LEGGVEDRIGADISDPRRARMISPLAIPVMMLLGHTRGFVQHARQPLPAKGDGRRFDGWRPWSRTRSPPLIHGVGNPRRPLCTRLGCARCPTDTLGHCAARHHGFRSRPPTDQGFRSTNRPAVTGQRDAAWFRSVPSSSLSVVRHEIAAGFRRPFRSRQPAGN